MAWFGRDDDRRWRDDDRFGHRDDEHRMDWRDDDRWRSDGRDRDARDWRDRDTRGWRDRDLRADWRYGDVRGDWRDRARDVWFGDESATGDRGRAGDRTIGGQAGDRTYRDRIAFGDTDRYGERNDFGDRDRYYAGYGTYGSYGERGYGYRGGARGDLGHESRWSGNQGGYGYGDQGYDRSYGTTGRYDDRYRLDRDRPEWNRGGRTWEMGDRERGEGWGFGGNDLTGDAARRMRGPKNYRRSDDRIRDDINDRLMTAGVDASEVEVQVRDAEVTLSGTVETRRDKRRIEDVAESVLGVRDVLNHLKVNRGFFERLMHPNETTDDTRRRTTTGTTTTTTSTGTSSNDNGRGTMRS